MDYQYKILNIETTEADAFNIIAIVNKVGYEDIIFHFDDIKIEPSDRNPSEMKIAYIGSIEAPDNKTGLIQKEVENTGDDLFEKILSDVFQAQSQGISPEEFLETH